MNLKQKLTQLAELFRGGSVNRRDFLRQAVAFGASTVVAYGLLKTLETTDASAQVATTLALGEEDNRLTGVIGEDATGAIGEEHNGTTLEVGEEGTIPSRALGEENWGTTLAVGEENQGSTRALGEEDQGTTLALGEEDQSITKTSAEENWGTTLELGEESNPSTQAWGEEGSPRPVNPRFKPYSPGKKRWRD